MLTQRAIAEELMDSDDLDPDTYAVVVHDLAQVNTLTLARRPTLRFLNRIALRQEPIRILDVGFGDGDMLRAIAKWSRSVSQPVELVGIDLNPRSAPAALASTHADMAIEYRTGDYANLSGGRWDVILSSLVAHHMTDGQLINFLQFMDQEATRGWFINDLHRHGFAWTGFPLLARVMRWHPIVRHDGQLSIARSYRVGEWGPILAAAGITDARVTRFFPFRLCVAKFR